MLNTQEISLAGEMLDRFREEGLKYDVENSLRRIWQKDATVWTNSGEENWLGWLTIGDETLNQAEQLKEFGRQVSERGFESVVLLGMGGSSLCPEVLAKTFQKEDFFRVLDSTVPSQVLRLAEEIDPSKTLFIVASKSGSTLEPNAFMAYFLNQVVEAVGEEKAGLHFVAITDPGSKLESFAKEQSFWRIFHGEPTVGGRFSALSVFGMVPHAAMGLYTGSFLKHAQNMRFACNDDDVKENPGALLGLFLGVAHNSGRDKLTIFTSESVSSLGAWMEQLIAESTGKNGVSIIPVDGEQVADVSKYGDDRVFAFIMCGDDEKLSGFAEELKEAGHPIAVIHMESEKGIGQEFFRWEMATAVAGSLMNINPFDQPDVEAAKIASRAITDEYEESGQLPEKTMFTPDVVFSFDGDSDVLTSLDTDIGASTVVREHLDRINAGDYLAIAAYVDMNDQNVSLVSEIREFLQSNYQVATTVGFGPRFLHSTGQAHKGGRNNGVFLQLTAEEENDADVPGQSFTFNVIKEAQARGDFEVLKERGRRALHIHFRNGDKEGLAALKELLEDAIRS